jgi:FMN-dependent NADH-azoreductase
MRMKPIECRQTNGFKETAMNILQINASIRGDASTSTRIADDIVQRLRTRHPDARLVRRDLAAAPHPVLDPSALQALFTPAGERTAQQAARVALDDTLIAEVQAADALVLGVPMYNLNVPVQFKTWIDAIARAGVTFRYTETGPEGLLKGKTAYVALARGGRYRGTDFDTQVPYLRTVLGFLGITDIHFIHAEGLNMGPDAVQQGLAEAGAALDAVFA